MKMRRVFGVVLVLLLLPLFSVTAADKLQMITSERLDTRMSIGMRTGVATLGVKELSGVSFNDLENALLNYPVNDVRTHYTTTKRTYYSVSVAAEDLWNLCNSSLEVWRPGLTLDDKTLVEKISKVYANPILVLKSNINKKLGFDAYYRICLDDTSLKNFDNLTIYVYSSGSNSFSLIKTSYRVDEGYLTFTAPYGRHIVISDEPLIRWL